MVWDKRLKRLVFFGVVSAWRHLSMV